MMPKLFTVAVLWRMNGSKKTLLKLWIEPRMAICIPPSYGSVISAMKENRVIRNTFFRPLCISRIVLMDEQMERYQVDPFVAVLPLQLLKLIKSQAKNGHVDGLIGERLDAEAVLLLLARYIFPNVDGNPEGAEKAHDCNLADACLWKSRPDQHYWSRSIHKSYTNTLEQNYQAQLTQVFVEVQPLHLGQ